MMQEKPEVSIYPEVWDIRTSSQNISDTFFIEGKLAFCELQWLPQRHSVMPVCKHS